MRYPEQFDIKDTPEVLFRLRNIKPGEHIPYHMGVTLADSEGRGYAAMEAYAEGRALLVQERIPGAESLFTYWAVGCTQ
jgi:hypothetical protein